jgi:transcriptional regulator with XRE-family HTH domain
MTISERIFDLLKKQRKKQGDLARALGVRPTTVSEWNTGKREPSGSLYEKIAEYFGVSLDYLITGRPSRDAPVQQIIGNNNSNNVANIAGNVGGDLTEYERELLNVCAGFDIRRKTALLTYVYNLEKEMKENKES